ncbi:MAG: YjbQ family protein [Candidatus Omnitrophica bacterium]|nr:YjbQ family protein [Candidatus Omnitrophota bacterium]
MVKVKTITLDIPTKGDTDIINITGEVENALHEVKLKEGIVNISLVGSTGAITTIEYEPALVKDLKELLENLIPKQKRYCHDDTWGDANGYAHLRSSILGTSKTFPVCKGKISLGTWQQVALIDFDNRPRQRKVILQFVGE